MNFQENDHEPMLPESCVKDGCVYFLGVRDSLFYLFPATTCPARPPALRETTLWAHSEGILDVPVGRINGEKGPCSEKWLQEQKGGLSWSDVECTKDDSWFEVPKPWDGFPWQNSAAHLLLLIRLLRDCWESSSLRENPFSFLSYLLSLPAVRFHLIPRCDSIDAFPFLFFLNDFCVLILLLLLF